VNASESLAAVLEYKRAQLLKAVEHVEPIAGIDGGMAVFTPSLPRVWELNLLLGESGAVEPLMEAAERVQGAAGLRHRKVRFAGPGPSIDMLEAIASAAGWSVDRELVMVRQREPDSEPRRGATVREIGAKALASVEDRFVASEPYGSDPEVRRQLIAQHERWAHAAARARCIGIFDDGEQAGWCRLYEDDGVIEIDSVGVLPDRRGRGLGRTLLEGVLRLVPEDRLLFLLADTEDWPKDLYGRLGFEAVGERLGATNPG
jgi:ribosomal protein S18 acetylase RimI-like enzyme